MPLSSLSFLRGPLRALVAADSCSNPLPPYTERHADGVAGASLARKGLQVQVLVRLAVPCVSVTHDEPYEGAPVMKKFLLLVATAAGALAIQKKLKDQRAEQDLWAEATDKV